MADEIVYEIIGDTKKLDKAIESIEAKAKKAGESGGIGSLKASIESVGPAAMAAAAAISTYLVGQALSECIKSATEQEDALNRMNYALVSAGRYSQEASADFNEFASKIQNSTVVADEVTMTYLAVATAFSKTNEQAKDLTTAALNLSTAMGTSAEGAVRQLGASLGGHAGMLAKIIPEVRNLTEAQLKAGVAIDLVNQKFAGAAEQAAKTYSGRVLQVKNKFGELTEEVGFFITKSGALNKVLEMLGNKFLFLRDGIKAFREANGDIFGTMLTMAMTLTEGLILGVVPAFDILNNICTKLRETIFNVLDAALKVTQQDFSGAFDTLKDSLNSVFNISDYFDYEVTGQLIDYIERIKTEVANAQGVIGETIMSTEKENPLRMPTEELNNDIGIATMLLGGLDTRMKLTAKDWNASIVSMKKTLGTTMVQGVGTAMNAVGQALVNGGNAFEAFGKAMLGMFGQMATQLGMFYFLLGLATVYNDPARGGAMIAGGLALMVFGGVLQALAGGGAGSTGGGGGGATAGGAGTAGSVGDNTTALNEPAERQRATSIEVNIEGNVIGDKRTFGLEIADALNEAFGNDGIIIARGAIS